MTLPNFLGIGAPRCGTTWLDAQLRTHPQAYMPPTRKEVHFFDDNFERGAEWYARHFDGAPMEARAIGEISPRYLLDEQVPERIRAVLVRPKFVVILRNPVDRFVSGFNYTASRSSMRLDVEQKAQGWTYRAGLYPGPLQRYFEAFGREQVLVLIYEELFADTAAGLSEVARFLDLTPDGFAGESQMRRVNTAEAGNALIKWARRGGRQLRAWDLDWAANLGRRALGLVSATPPKPKALPPALLADLAVRYADSIAETEALLGRDLSIWRR